MWAGNVKLNLVQLNKFGICRWQIFCFATSLSIPDDDNDDDNEDYHGICVHLKKKLDRNVAIKTSP